MNAIDNRPHDGRLSVSKATLIKAAAPGAGAAIFPDIEGLLGSEIDDVDCGSAIAATLAGRHLHKSAEPQSGSRRTRADIDEHAIDVEAALIVDRSEA